MFRRSRIDAGGPSRSILTGGQNGAGAATDIVAAPASVCRLERDQAGTPSIAFSAAAISSVFLASRLISTITRNAVMTMPMAIANR